MRAGKWSGSMATNDGCEGFIDSTGAGRQGAGDARRRSRDGLGATGTNGVATVTNGWRELASGANLGDLKNGALSIAALMVLTTTMNALTAQADYPHVAPWEPVMWEVSSSVMILLLLWIPWLAVTLAAPGDFAARRFRSKARFVLIHAAAVLLFSALHVTGMVEIRNTIYRLFTDGTYDFGAQFAYEFRKDVVTYLILAAVFWLTTYLRRRDDGAVRPVSFDIRDGARIIRAPLGDILAVTAAGNYVEFLLVDGRRPLMRATLATVEAELSQVGFVRSHRSWLINVARVTGLSSDGSGDWTVELGAVEAPLSRRYPQALQQLKG